MKKFSFYLLVTLSILSCVFSENLISPKFLILNTTISSRLENQSFNFVLLPEKLEKGKYLQVFQGIFPIPSHFDIDLQSAFIYYSDELCSFCLFNNYINVLVGDIYKGNTKIDENKYLSRVFFKIEENLGNYDIGSVTNIKFILLTRVEEDKLSKKVILMSKSKVNSFFQVITAFLNRDSINKGELEIGYEFSLQDNSEPIKNNGFFRSSITIEGKKIIYVDFNQTNSVICYTNKGECNEI